MNLWFIICLRTKTKVKRFENTKVILYAYFSFTIFVIFHSISIGSQSYAAVIESIVIILSIILCILTFPIALCVCFKVVSEYERAVIFRLGRIRYFQSQIACNTIFDIPYCIVFFIRTGQASGPGVFFALPCIDDIQVVDLRTVTCVVDPQEILTKDSVTVTVDAVVYHRVSNPMLAITKVNAVFFHM